MRQKIKIKFRIPTWKEIKQMWVGWKIKRLKKQVDRLREETGVQMFVVKWQGKMRVISKRDFKYMRQRGMFPKTFTADNLKRISLYYTRTGK